MPPKAKEVPVEPKKEKVQLDAPQAIQQQLQTIYQRATLSGQLDPNDANVAVTNTAATTVKFANTTQKGATGQGTSGGMSPTKSAAFVGPQGYKQWQDRYGFSMEQELDWERQEQIEMKRAQFAAKKSQSSPSRSTSRSPSPRRSSPKRGAGKDKEESHSKEKRKESYDPIQAAGLATDAGLNLAETTDYDAVDTHAVVTVGPCLPQTGEGSKPPSQQLDDLVKQLVAPYMLSTWRLSEFDKFHFRFRAIFRWITHFVRLDPNPVPPPSQPNNSNAPASTAAAPKAPPENGSGVPSFVPGKAKHNAAPAFCPYNPADNDDSEDDEHEGAMTSLSETPALDATAVSSASNGGGDSAPPRPRVPAHVGEATALQVFMDRHGDCHQVATLYAFMCRHPSARIVQPYSDTKSFGHIPVTGCQPLEDVEANSLALHSQRDTVACPTGLTQEHVNDALGANPKETLLKHERRHAHCGTHPCRVVTVRGTLKGVLDKNGRTVGYIPWSWNVVTLPDGKRYLLDLGLAMAHVPPRYHLNYAAMLDALKEGNSVGAPASAAELAAAAATTTSSGGGKGGGNKGGGDKGGGAATQQGGAPFADGAASAAAAQVPPFFLTAQQCRSAMQNFSLMSAQSSGPTSLEKGATNACGAPMLLSGIAATAQSSAYAAVSLPIQSAASSGGAIFDPSAAAAPPATYQTAAALLTRTFQPFYFFLDPRKFTVLHYPDNQKHLLLGLPTESQPQMTAASLATVRRKTASGGLLSRAAWEIYPRLTHEFFEHGLHLSSHARRASFNIKGCPEYLSVAVDDPQHVEVKVQAFKCPVTTLLGAVPSAAPLAATATLSNATAASPPPDPHAIATWMTEQHQHQAAFLGSTVAPLLSAQPYNEVPSGFLFQSREEDSKRSVFTLMFPDIGLYTICIGVRRLSPVTGKPLTPFYSLATLYHLYVSFVPTNEPTLPLLLEPPTLAKLVSPPMSKIVAGNTYFSVVPTSPRVLGVAVVNKVYSVLTKAQKAAQDAAAKQAAEPTTPASPTTKPSGAKDKNAQAAKAEEEPQPSAQTAVSQNLVESVNVQFLPWDAKDSTFNGTVKTEIGAVEIWILTHDEMNWEMLSHHQESEGGSGGKQTDSKNFAPLEVDHNAIHTLLHGTTEGGSGSNTAALAASAEGAGSSQALAAAPAVAAPPPFAPMVPLHLMPNASQGQTALLAQSLLFPSAPRTANATATEGGTANPTPTPTDAAASASQKSQKLSGATARFLQQVLQLQSAAGFDTSGELGDLDNDPAQQGDEATAESQQPSKPQKGDKKAGGKAAAQAAAQQQQQAAAEKPHKRPPPARGCWVPFITGIQAVKRVSSKDMALLTNGHVLVGNMAGAAPADGVNNLPTSLLYPITLENERPMINRLLAMKPLEQRLAPTGSAQAVKKHLTLMKRERDNGLHKSSVGGYFKEQTATKR